MFLLLLNLIFLPDVLAQTTQNLRLQAEVEQTLWTNTEQNEFSGGTNFRMPAQLLLEPLAGESVEVEINGEITLIDKPTFINTERWTIRNPTGKKLQVSIINH